MSKKRYEIVSYDIPLWLKPVLSVTETSIYTGISANKIYEMSDSKGSIQYSKKSNLR